MSIVTDFEIIRVMSQATADDMAAHVKSVITAHGLTEFRNLLEAKCYTRVFPLEGKERSIAVRVRLTSSVSMSELEARAALICALLDSGYLLKSLYTVTKRQRDEILAGKEATERERDRLKLALEESRDVERAALQALGRKDKHRADADARPHTND